MDMENRLITEQFDDGGMSARLGFLDLPVEIRLMIYRLLFCPSAEPILISFYLTRSIKRSAQLLRVCRTCYEEASMVLYAENVFAVDWAYSGTEPSILNFLENIGAKNRQLIRHLQARHHSMRTLVKMQSRRSLRLILENLETLSLEFYDANGAVKRCWPGVKNGFTILREVHRYLKKQRGPYQKLARAFRTDLGHSLYHTLFKVDLASAAIRSKPKGPEWNVDAEMERSKHLFKYRPSL